MRITNKTKIHSQKPIPVYCLEVPGYHNFSVQVNKDSALTVKNCKSYNLDKQ